MGTGLVYKFRELINKPSNLKKKNGPMSRFSTS